MLVWIRGSAQIYSAERVVDLEHTVQLLVESLGTSGWDWHVWDTGARLPARYGLSNDVGHAKAQAEAAFGLMMVQLSLRRST